MTAIKPISYFYRNQIENFRFMVMETWAKKFKGPEKYYHSGADIPFNFNLMAIKPESGSKEIKAMIDSWMEKMPVGKWPNFVVCGLKL